MSKYKVRAKISYIVEIMVDAESRAEASDIALEDSGSRWLDAIDGDPRFDVVIREIEKVL